MWYKVFIILHLIVIFRCTLIVFSRSMTSGVFFLAISYLILLVKIYLKSIVDWNFLIYVNPTHITHYINKIYMYIRIYILFSLWIRAMPLKPKKHCATASPICPFLRYVGIPIKKTVVLDQVWQLFRSKDANHCGDHGAIDRLYTYIKKSKFECMQVPCNFFELRLQTVRIG